MDSKLIESEEAYLTEISQRIRAIIYCIQVTFYCILMYAVIKNQTKELQSYKW
jgi:hypothetical protein